MNDSIQRLAAQRLDHSRTLLASKYPYHAAWVSAARFTADPSVGTMCVMLHDQQVAYRYAPRFAVDCTPLELVGVLQHEINHVLFGHVSADPRDFPNNYARLIAEETTVNEFVREPLPGEPIRLEDFPFLPPREDTTTRYQRLVERGRLPAHLRPLDNHTRWLSAADLSLSALHDLLVQSRTLWELPEDVREALSQHLKNRGGSGRPAKPTVAQVSARAVSTERLNWKSLIDRAAGFATWRSATYGQPPRRLPHLLGITPAYRIRGHRQSIMAVIDTSRSMTFVHLGHILRELKHLTALGMVTVVECDNEIRDFYPLRNAIKRVSGRGSTDLRPVFQPQFLAQVRPDVVVYFTDGEGPAPDHAPRAPVVWCLTPDGRRPAPWGVTARLPV